VLSPPSLVSVAATPCCATDHNFRASQGRVWADQKANSAAALTLTTIWLPSRVTTSRWFATLR
jgi:hypothetical protein